jgi:hypothetical protein
MRYKINGKKFSKRLNSEVVTGTTDNDSDWVRHIDWMHRASEIVRQGFHVTVTDENGRRVATMHPHEDMIADQAIDAMGIFQEQEDNIVEMALRYGITDAVERVRAIDEQIRVLEMAYWKAKAEGYNIITEDKE